MRIICGDPRERDTFLNGYTYIRVLIVDREREVVFKRKKRNNASVIVRVL